MTKYLLGISLLLVNSISIAQQKVVTQAIISTTTNIIAPEDDEQNNPGAGNGRMNFASMMDGETKSTTWVKNDMVKTLLKSDVIKSTIIRNNATKLTTTLMEVMGNKWAFSVTDSEQVETRRKMDSAMQSRRKADTAATARQHTEPKVDIVETGENKKIAGYNCKKAWVISSHFPGVKDTVTVWYTPEIKIQNISSTGGLSGLGNMGAVSGLDKFDGMVMRYEMSLRRNKRMEVEVTKIDDKKEIADNEFEIPKGFEIKSMKEIQNMFGGRGLPGQRPN